MWMWPLDGAMGATATHRVPEKEVDGTCTQVWAWITNKCIKRMNGEEWYITIEISQRRGGTKKKRKRGGERGSWEVRGVGNSHPRLRSPFSLRHRAIWSYVPSSYSIIPPTSIPTVTPSEPNFWTHSLQIHCNESTGLRFRPSLDPVRKMRPYNYIS